MGTRALVYTVTVADEHGEQHTFGPKDKVPAWAQKAITNPSAWGEEADDESGSEPSGSSGYSSMKKAELEQEVEDRNAERAPESQIEVGGNGTVKDLIAALEADDESQA